jgi:DNA-binding NtrC family response regulator
MSTKGKQYRVFVVDDEHIIASSLATILRLQGFDAMFFTDPLVALQAAESETPDLLISDVVMPKVSGVELGIMFRERFPACKVLLFSGQAATANLLQTARSKGHDFELLLKPVQPADLLTRIRATSSVSPQPCQ